MSRDAHTTLRVFTWQDWRTLRSAWVLALKWLSRLAAWLSATAYSQAAAIERHSLRRTVGWSVGSREGTLARAHLPFCYNINLKRCAPTAKTSLSSSSAWPASWFSPWMSLWCYRRSTNTISLRGEPCIKCSLSATNHSWSCEWSSQGMQSMQLPSAFYWLLPFQSLIVRNPLIKLPSCYSTIPILPSDRPYYS